MIEQCLFSLRNNQGSTEMTTRDDSEYTNNSIVLDQLILVLKITTGTLCLNLI